MAEAPALFGTLGDAPISEHFKLIYLKNAEALQFGWGRLGAGGSYTLQQNYVGYFPHRSGSSPDMATFPVDAQIWYGNDVPLGCSLNDVMQYAQTNLFCPFWFFDWCKQYLALLRAYQPKFDAPAGAKLVWVTQVAWVINAALGATNLHGSILPSAIYEHITGSSFDEWAGDGAYMYTAQHAAALPEYWKDAWTDAANAVLAKQKGDVLLDSGYKVFNRKYEIQWESAWRGGVFHVPLETTRYRYDPPILVSEDTFRETKYARKGLAGAHYNNTIVNDPYIIRDSTGRFLDDGGRAIQRYAMWSMFTPWAQMRAFGGWDSGMARALDPNNRALLAPALVMSTLFSPGEGLINDALFWNRLNAWYGDAHAKPALIQTGLVSSVDVSLTKGAKLSMIPLFTPNYELSFRYFYPAMIDLLLACDFYGLINTGVNTWWKYNINSGSGVGMFKATEDTVVFDPATGKQLRDKNGILYGAPVIPAGTVQQQRGIYEKQAADNKGIKIAINLAQSFLAVLQAVVGGNYGALVSAGKSWYDSFAKKFPKPEDSWRGVVPPTPLVQRRIPSFNFVKTEHGVEPTIPTVGGWTRQNPTELPSGGGATVLAMMSTVRGYMFALRRFGAPFTLTPDDRIDLEGIRNPVSTLNSDAPRSIVFPEFPEPGFAPGSKEALDTVNAATTPAPRSKGGLLILGFGFVSALVGVLLAKRSDLNLRPWRR